MSATEKAVAATLLSPNGSDLTPNLRRLQDAAPDGWDDLRCGEVAKAIRVLRQQGKPVHRAAVMELVQFEGSSLFIGELVGNELPIDLAEIEAEKIWSAFVPKRMAALFEEGAQALLAGPTEAGSIAQHVKAELESLQNESRPKYTTRSIGDIEVPTDGDPAELIRHRFLCKGGGLLLAAPSGVGKSTFAIQAMLCFGAGRACFGFIPTRPLRSAYLQGENDDPDLAELRDGILTGLNFTPEERALALQNVRFVTVDDVCGEAFIHQVVEPLCRDGKPDLVWIDPLLSFIGGDVSRQEIVSPWLRNHLNPVLHRHGVGCVLIHHTNKPPSGKEKPNWQAGDLAYLGSGSAELANWPRAVIAIRSTGSHTVFELCLGKRGARAHWRNPDGSTCFSRFIAHGTDGIYWREADPEECPAPAGRKAQSSVEDIVRLLTVQLSTSDWQKMARTECGVSERSFYRLKKQAESTRTISQSKIDQKWFKTP
jgi:hypothetical protein